MTSISINKQIVVLMLLIGFVSTASGQFYYNDQGSSITDSNDYFVTPQFETQEEIATELVAPFIFITVLLHFALSKAFNFILAEDVEEGRYHAIPYGIPLKDRGHNDRPDARKYSMIMSLTITASLVPTPYWSWIRATMGLIGFGTILAFIGIVGFVLYLMFSN